MIEQVSQQGFREQAATVHEIDPREDVRWRRFLESHPQASVFHSPEWLAALDRTYGFRAAALTTSGPREDLANGLVFCRVQSWLTGRRVVAAPFSDHCIPLVSNFDELIALLSGLKRDRGRGRYFEIRSLSDRLAKVGGFTPAETFCLHRLDLHPSCEEIFRGFHPNHVRRKIARAEREGLAYEEGRSEFLLQKFYRLALLTRRRQRLPPQPITWFRNLVACLGEKLKIRIVSHRGQPAAAALTLHYKNTMTYKYGCSDAQYHRLGAMQLVLWKAIQDAKNQALTDFDMGRSDWGNDGLIAFKDHWGAARSCLFYFRDPLVTRRLSPAGTSLGIVRRLLSLAPDLALATAGSLLYRHIA